MRCFLSRSLTALTLVGIAVISAGNAAYPEDRESGQAVKLEKLTWSQFQQRLANPRVKYTVVDAWSTTCGPCKENFPHVVEMHRKYAPKGLAIVSLSLDDPSDKTAVTEAETVPQGKEGRLFQRPPRRDFRRRI